MIYNLIGLGVSLVGLALCSAYLLRLTRKIFNEALARLHQDFLTSRGYRDNADEHIERLRKMLIEREEAYGRLLTQPPEERFNAYVKELQDLLKHAEILSRAVSEAREVQYYNDEDSHLDPDYVPIPEDLAEALKRIGEAKAGWAKARGEYLSRGNNPVPEMPVHWHPIDGGGGPRCVSSSEEQNWGAYTVTRDRKLLTCPACIALVDPGRSSQNTEEESTR